jgi:hypothetical protein
MTRPYAVYRHYSENGTLLYVGRSADPEARWLQLSSTQPGWTPYSVQRDDKWYPTFELAAAAERWAIRTEAPMFNTVHAKRRREDRVASEFGTAVRRMRTLILADGVEVQFEARGKTWRRVLTVYPRRLFPYATYEMELAVDESSAQRDALIRRNQAIRNRVAELRAAVDAAQDDPSRASIAAELEALVNEHVHVLGVEYASWSRAEQERHWREFEAAAS